MNPSPTFSEREHEVIARLMQGCSNKQIAQSLGITPRTVEFHLGNIYAKLNIASRAEAILQLTQVPKSQPVENHSMPDSRSEAAEPWKSTVEVSEDLTQNSENTFPKRRPLMRKLSRVLLILLIVLVLAGMIFFVVWNAVVKNWTDDGIQYYPTKTSMKQYPALKVTVIDEGAQAVPEPGTPLFQYTETVHRSS